MFVCSGCGKCIKAWSDGNPYYIDSREQKRYVYHPDHENLARCVGNDVPHMCLSCGELFNVDSQQKTDHCPKCSSKTLSALIDLLGKACPLCHAGVFQKDLLHHPIS